MRIDSMRHYPHDKAIYGDALRPSVMRVRRRYTSRFSEVAGNNLWRFDLQAAQWEILANLPRARVVRGQIMVTGGERLDTVPFQLVPSMEIFAPGAAAWVQGPQPPILVHGTTGAAIDGEFVLTAGSDEAGTTSLNRATQVYAPAPQ